jgi:WD40 repeat protein
LSVLEGHNDWVLSLLYSEKDNVLLSASSDGNIKIWEIDTYVCIKTICLAISVRKMVLLPNRYIIAVSDYCDPVRILNMSDFRCVNILEDSESLECKKQNIIA